MKKLIFVSCLLAFLIIGMSYELLSHDIDEVSEALMNAAMERAIRGEF